MIHRPPAIRLPIAIAICTITEGKEASDRPTTIAPSPPTIKAPSLPIIVNPSIAGKAVHKLVSINGADRIKVPCQEKLLPNADE